MYADELASAPAALGAKPTSARVESVALGLLAADRVGRAFTAVIEQTVGEHYSSNASVATLALLSAGSLRPRDLSAAIGLPTPTVSRTIDRLEASNDVTREGRQVADDGRAVLIRLTRRGRRQERAIAEALVASAGSLSASIDEVAARFDGGPGGLTAPPEPTATGLSLALAQAGIAAGGVLRSAADDVAGALTLCALVADGGESRPSLISEQVGLTSGGTTKVLDRLESDGAIERCFGTSTDRRAVVLTLTTSGRQRVEEMVVRLEPHLPRLQRLFASLGEYVARKAS